MYNLTFLPFIGKSYNNNNAFGNKRIMVLGESHYGSVPSPDITRDVLARYLDPTLEREGWMNTFLKFERSLVNKETTREDSRIIWDSLLFYNYVQVLMDDTRTAATKQQYRDSEAAFFQVMEENQPDILIVWGRRLWSNLPYTNWEDGEEILVDGYAVDNGFYTLKNGHKVRAFCVYHPSAGYDWSYWHKVISKFINSEDKASNVIDGVGFSNFRRFKDFPSLHLGGVNIIVGANNAGKSTFDKATKLFLDFIQKWLTGNTISINFESDLCKELGINSYEDALNYNADKEHDALSFNMMVGRYVFEATFMPGELEAKENTTANAVYVKLVDNQDNDSEYVFHYDRSQNSAIVDVTLPTFSPALDGLDVIERFLSAPLCPIEKELKEGIHSNLDIIRDCYESSNYSDGKMIEAFRIISESIGENTPKDFDLFESLRTAMKQVADSQDSIELEITLPRNATPKVLFETLRGINAIQPKFDESRRNDPRVIEARLCPIITLSQNKTLHIDAKDSVSHAVTTFCQKWRRDLKDDGFCYLSTDSTSEDTIGQFLGEWLKNFKIGTNLRFRNLCNESFYMEVMTMDNHWSPLTSMGMGSVHLVTLLLTIANFCIGIGNLTKQVLIIEEPEINLHPDRQSLLANLLLDIFNRFGIQVIVETHSEYLVRKMQVIVANVMLSEDQSIDNVNQDIKVYYFPEREEPYPMVFKNNGRFQNKFGQGFFDESSRANYELVLLENRD